MEGLPMRDDLARAVLDELLGWTEEERADWVTDLNTMADYKFDDYEGFSAGKHFFEQLARWLSQFDCLSDRRRLAYFVRKELVFISRQEMNQAISCVYPHYIKPMLFERAARKTGIPKYQLRQLASSPDFKALRRKTVFMGLSDGARLDQLRRSSQELSHEQFSPTTEPGKLTRQSMAAALQDALNKFDASNHEPKFENVVLVDDFYGSGTSLIGQQEDGTWKGKLSRAYNHIGDLALGEIPVVVEDPEVVVVLYVASSQAKSHIESMLVKLPPSQSFQPTWRLNIIQELPQQLKVVDAKLLQICDNFFDPAMEDEHKGVVPRGYKDAALPVVLFHNTPNNSISPLWADTESTPDSLQKRALFPRYERHHADRP